MNLVFRAPALERALIVALLGAACLLGCSPRFNWRSDPKADGFAATFPGRVDALSRVIDLNGTPVTMTLHGARVDDLSFALGWVDLSDRQPETAQQAADAVKAGLEKGMPGHASVKEASVRSLAPQAPPWPAKALTLDSTQSGSPWRMEARIVARPGRVYEIVVVGPTAALGAPEAATAEETFFESVQIE